MLVRQATEEDMESVATLHRQSILDLCKTYHSDEQLKQWTAALRAHRPQAAAVVTLNHG